jgi:hypothetical protein
VLDVRATHYVSPLAEVPFTDTTLTVHLVNVADETGLVTGKFRVYNDTTGALIHTSEIAPLTMVAGQTSDVSALTDFDPPAPLDDVYFVIFDGTASNPLVPDGISFALGAFTFDVKVGPLGPAPAAHAVTHEEAGADPIETEDLGTAELDATLVLTPDGAGGLAFVAPSPLIDHGLTQGLADDDHPQYQEEDEKGAAAGYCGLPAALDPTLPLRADGLPARPQSYFASCEFLGTFNIAQPWVEAAISSGTAPTLAGEATHPGIHRYTAAMAPLSGYRCYLAVNGILIRGAERACFKIRPQTLANSIIRAGFTDSAGPVAGFDGVYFLMDPALGVAGQTVGVCIAGGVASLTATSFTLVTNTWYFLCLIVNDAATLATFKIFNAAGVLLWSDTVNANIPTAVGQETGHAIIATSSATVAIVDLDYISIEFRKPLYVDA